MQKGEIEGRFDPDMILYNRKTLRFNFPVKQLKQLLRAKPQYGSNQAGIDRNSIHEARYIRITDIDEYGLLKNNLGVTAEFIEEKHILKNNDLLFARSGATVGKAYLHTTDSVNYECFYAGYMIRFLVNENVLLSKFLFCYTQLEVYKEWVKAIQRAAGQPNINAEEYKSLSVPVPPLETQVKIINIFETAYNSKKQKEAEAAELLASIDAYLLEQLGITLPPQTEKKTSFIIHFNKLSGGRFDPFYHRVEFDKFENNLINGKYEILLLKELTFKIETGKGIYQFDPIGFDYLNVNNIKKWEVDLLKTEKIENIKNYQNVVKKGDILTGRVGTIGNFALYGFEKESLISDNILKLCTKNNVSSPYLTYILNSNIIFQQLKRNSKGAVQEVINTQTIRNLKIPLPLLDKQEEIAARINGIRARAKQLQQQAVETLEQAKQSVEKMILGD